MYMYMYMLAMLDVASSRSFLVQAFIQGSLCVMCVLSVWCVLYLYCCARDVFSVLIFARSLLIFLLCSVSVCQSSVVQGLYVYRPNQPVALSVF